jgi:hypothetical protein
MTKQNRREQNLSPCENMKSKKKIKIIVSPPLSFESIRHGHTSLV